MLLGLNLAVYLAGFGFPGLVCFGGWFLNLLFLGVQFCGLLTTNSGVMCRFVLLWAGLGLVFCD